MYQFMSIHSLRMHWSVRGHSLHWTVLCTETMSTSSCLFIPSGCTGQSEATTFAGQSFAQRPCVPVHVYSFPQDALVSQRPLPSLDSPLHRDHVYQFMSIHSLRMHWSVRGHSLRWTVLCTETMSTSSCLFIPSGCTGQSEATPFAGQSLAQRPCLPVHVYLFPQDALVSQRLLPSLDSPLHRDHVYQFMSIHSLRTHWSVRGYSLRWTVPCIETTQHLTLPMQILLSSNAQGC